jgi:hypothetical protein
VKLDLALNSEEKEEKLNALTDEIENSLYIIGLTALEDEL